MSNFGHLPSRPPRCAAPTLDEPGPGAATPTPDELATLGAVIATGAVVAYASALSILPELERAMETDAIETLKDASHATDARLG